MVLKKTDAPRSHFRCDPGPYFYDNDVISVAKGITPLGARRLEITDVNRHYLEQDHCRWKARAGHGLGGYRARINLCSRGNFIRVIEERQGPESRLPGRNRLPARYITADEVLACGATREKRIWRYLETMVSEGGPVFDED
ncbi:MAG: hypothetical protein CM15mP25_0690 [Gammaproteobacteria bacterium]|nr:MAG: hypothetical protein CM15mP25_0690 [Gammaproteobacteria bacterium]